MKLVKVRFDRVFDVVWRTDHRSAACSCVCFGFESNGKRIFSVSVQGCPKLEPGMTVIALLSEPDNWSSFLGWVDCADGSVAYVYDQYEDEAPIGLYGNPISGFALVGAFSLISIPGWIAYIETQQTMALVFLLFLGSIALLQLYNFMKGRLIKRALFQIRDEVLKELVQSTPLP